jgi:glyceraldehyde 3-phosphate dehydrogenase
MESQLVVGQNGFGRFGLNLLWRWMQDRSSPYRIGYINDEKLSPQQIESIIKTDPLVTGFKKCKVFLSGHTLLLQEPDGRKHHIILTNGPIEQASWLGEPDLFFECSGSRSASSELCRPFLIGKTQVVIVSATCYDADTTLIVGFNHENYEPGAHKVISYGSCTVNPGVPLSEFFNAAFGVKGCTVNVIHNVQKHRLDLGESHTLQRKFCTLERVAPLFLPFLTKTNFTVNYTVIPWEGASIIDFSYYLDRPPTRDDLISALHAAIGKGGPLQGLIGIIASDSGPEVHIGSPFSAVIVESEVKMLGDTAHLFCYFYNEGSSVRMHELASYVACRLS